MSNEKPGSTLAGTVVPATIPATTTTTNDADGTLVGHKTDLLDETTASSSSTTDNNDNITHLHSNLDGDEQGFFAALARMRNKAPKALLLYTVSFAQFIDIVNGASMTVAMLPIAIDLGFEPAEMQWIISSYGLAFAGLLLVAGRTGDWFGHRRVFLCGLFWFGFWALIVSFSTNSVMFCIARALQGTGAAFTIPTALALISTNYEVGKDRTRALSIFGAFGAMGAVIGILLAGGMIASIGWRWVFRFSSILVSVLWILGFVAIPDRKQQEQRKRELLEAKLKKEQEQKEGQVQDQSPPPPQQQVPVVVPTIQKKPKVDFGGAFFATASITMIVYYISVGVDLGWASVKTLPVFLVGLVCLGIFLWLESWVKDPIMPFRVWHHRYFASSFVVIFILQGMFGGFIYFTNLIFQQVYGFDSMQTAVAFLPHSLLAIFVFAILGRILPRFPLKPFILASCILRIIAALLFAFITPSISYWALAFPALLIHVFGLGFSMLPLQITALKDAKNADQGIVGALYNVGLQMGAPLGLSILTVISGKTNTKNGVTHGPELMAGYKNAMFGIVAFGVVAFIVAAFLIPNDKRAALKDARRKQEAEDATTAAAAAATATEADAVVVGTSVGASTTELDRATMNGGHGTVIEDMTEATPATTMTTKSTTGVGYGQESDYKQPMTFLDSEFDNDHVATTNEQVLEAEATAVANFVGGPISVVESPVMNEKEECPV